MSEDLIIQIMQIKYECGDTTATAFLHGPRWQIRFENPHLDVQCPKDRNPNEVVARVIDRLRPLTLALDIAYAPVEQERKAYDEGVESLRTEFAST
jgi:hypothetical protein